MKITIAVCLLITVLVAAVSAQSFHGPTWEQLSASDKMSQLWAALMNNKNANDWPSAFASTELFLESMNVTLETVSDDMPKQFLGLQTRPKLIHSVGPLSKAKWVNLNSNYSGLFRGASNCIIRFSTAQKPDTSAALGFIPGFGIKCLRSGVPSGNFVAMYSLYGQSSFNFFKHDFTNHVPAPDTATISFLQVQLLKRFADATPWPNMVALSDFAGFNEAGVREAQINFPFRLVFHPKTALHNMFPDQNGANLNEMLATVKVGDMYDVYAEPVPNAALVKIATITITTVPSASYFGDAGMFLKHQRMEDDFRYHPEWIDPAAALVNKQSNTDNWVYPDLPWN